jgi:hypothetical protein
MKEIQYKMEVKLDKSILEIINSNYQIDPSVFRDIETRRQNSEGAANSIKTILENSPSPPPTLENSNSTTDQIINNINYKYTLNDRQLKSILDLLSLTDVSIDNISKVIQNLDSKTVDLINELNGAINAVTTAYAARITIGCRSDLIWNNIGISTGKSQLTGAAVTFSNYTVIKNPSQKVTTNYYGLKYYQKPSNREYGFNIISEVSGSIAAGSQTLAVVGTGSTSGIQIGDEITDNLNTPIAFNIGNLPKVVGFGSTSILGITTSIYGSVSLGSTIIATSGIGSTGNISIGNYVSNIDVYTADTQVVGFGTTVVIINYNNNGISSTTNVIVPSVILNKVSISSITNGNFGFSTYTEYQALRLSAPSNLNINDEIFTVIRNTEDISQNFNYTNNPLDPITIGIMDKSRVGTGHEIEVINNGNTSGPYQWRQILDNPEPLVGASSTFHYIGISSWPYDAVNGYAEEGEVYKFTESTNPTYTSTSPTGLSTNGAICNSYTQNITIAETNLQTIINNNLPEIQRLISTVLPLRKQRDTDELQAWAYLQSASYLRGEINNLKSDINSLSSFDYNSL